jgi:hypothetical protein
MVIGVFDSHEQAEAVVRRLIDAGVQPEHISVVAKDLQEKERVTGYVTAKDVAKDFAGTGAWAGGLFGLLAGAALLFLPVTGPIVILGPLVGAAIGALEGGIVGGLMGAILGSAVEPNKVLKYEQYVEAGKVLVIVEGSPDELERVRQIMGETNDQDIDTFEPAAAA